MDSIQKVLIKAGRKDLAEEYFEKVSSDNKLKGMFNKADRELMPLQKSFLKVLDSIDKTYREIDKYLLDNDTGSTLLKIEGVSVKHFLEEIHKDIHIQKAGDLDITHLKKNFLRLL